MSKYTNEKAQNEIVFYKDDGRLAANTMKLEPSDEVLKELYRLRAENEKLRDGVRSTIQERDVLSGENFDLRAENEKLRAALKPFADVKVYPVLEDTTRVYDEPITYGDLRAARAALGEKNDN